MLADDYHNGERVRLAAVKALELLDTPSDPSFDAIVALVAQHFACPIGLVTLIDRDRQWFKARCGLQAIETSRDVAFCNYTIQSPRLLVVEDATKDARFRHNPLVTGAPHVLCGWLPRCKGSVTVWRAGRVQSCVRPVRAVIDRWP